LKESDEQKAEANKLFTTASYKEAIEAYEKALSTCPNYLDYEIAVLRSNLAACHLKLEDWKEAVKAATAAIDGLDKLEQSAKESPEAQESGAVDELEAADEEIISAGAAKAEDASVAKKRKDDIDRIRAKALMRRAKARSELGGWSSLQGAEEGTFKL
jgi:tetratricopeptide (TPR) repeat protein